MVELSLLRTCLDRLEQVESVLLAWGDCDSYFPEWELLDLLRATVPEVDPEDLLEDLCRKAMVVQVQVPGGGTAYRTRMGQGLHLFRNLRQWMPSQTMEASRTLVSDFRFLLRPRRYPARNLEADAVVRQCEAGPGLSVHAREALGELLGIPSAPIGLAGFQARATERILAAYRHHSGVPSQQTGTIVCAGTGSGKTLAFYLPALASLAADLVRDPRPQVRILAIYPRKELLKDQFTETYRQCRRLDSLLARKACRKIRIGALFGDTPRDADHAHRIKSERGQKEMAFSTLRCPDPACTGTLNWPESLRASGQQGLSCPRCHTHIGPDEVLLTREAMSRTAPDILFTTTEMLNQNLGNPFLNPLFGVGARRGPTLVLLDEAHTYGGNTGAQTAYLLRRWMHRSECRPHFVGLSATLSDAARFFADLISARPALVEQVEPGDQELQEEGAEYLLVLRGDAVSQTALLSTTIQTTMLLERILDNERRTSEDTWGTKTFVFADDLDVVNRLYGQVADAEGYTHRRGRLEARGLPLASLRFPISVAPGGGPRTRPDPVLRLRLGQDWSVVQDIRPGFRAEDRLRLGRTSSQDAGVDAQAEVIIATASLEVGFNDPAVGAILQHKAPRDFASYLQRRGRAGRTRGMRPWTIVVLSEYGRDRVLFQRYEELQDPVVKRQRLPVGNTHILKMQGAMAVLDWLSLELGGLPIWQALNRPQANAGKLAPLAPLLSRVLIPESRDRESMKKYLLGALGLSQEQLDQVLWSSPRSLMLEFIPTLQRLASTNWREGGQDWAAAPSVWGSPLPEYLPSTLFGDLNTPELTVDLPRPHGTPPMEALPFFQGLREFAPGRISKRFAVASADEFHWLVPQGFTPAGGGLRDFELSEAFSGTTYPETQVTGPNGQPLAVYRPAVLRPNLPDRTLGLAERSNAQPDWGTEFRPSPFQSTFEPPRGPWEGRIERIDFNLHRDLAPLELIRYSTGAAASLRFRDGRSCQVGFRWHRQGEPVAIGTRLWVDGVRLVFPVSAESLFEWVQDPEVARALRPAWFRRQVLAHEAFRGEPFKADWVAECCLAVLADRILHLAAGSTLQEAVEWMTTSDGRDQLLEIPSSYFQLDDSTGAATEQRLQAALRDWLAQDAIVDGLGQCARSLWEPLEESRGFLEWVREVLGNTIAAAVQQALFHVLPEVDEASILADIVHDKDHLQVWLSEAEPGGSGVLSQWADAYQDDPVRMLGLVAACLRPSDYEQIDHDLHAALILAVDGDAPLAPALTAFREAQDSTSRRRASRHLQRELRNRGFALSKSFLSVFNSRVLWQGSSGKSDRELLTWLRRWTSLETESGLEWPLAVVAHALTWQAGGAAGTGAEDRFRHSCLILARMWARGGQVRRSELSFYSPFANGTPFTERMLGAKLVADHSPHISAAGMNWWPAAEAALRSHGQVQILVPWAEPARLREVIIQAQVAPIEYLGMLVYPRLAGVRRWRDDFVLTVELAEIIH